MRSPCELEANICICIFKSASVSLTVPIDAEEMLWKSVVHYVLRPWTQFPWWSGQMLYLDFRLSSSLILALVGHAFARVPQALAILASE